MNPGESVAGDAGQGGLCLNCGAALAGPYCSACGQKAHLHRSVLHAAEEFLHGILHFDSRLWTTLPLLALRPGKLTRDYVMGRRARYIAPVAVFLLTIFAMFLLFAFLPAPGVEVARDASAAKQGEAARPSDLYEAMRRAAASDRTAFDVGDPGMEKKLRAALANPEFVAYKIKQKGYKLSFLLVPLSLPWLMLMFAGRRDVKAYDHVVFLLYSISFMSMLVMIASALAILRAGNSFLFGLLLIWIPLAHMFAQLKEGYALGWFGAAWRTVALAAAAVATLAIYVAGIALLGLMD